MSSPYGPSGGQQDPNAPWGQQPYGAPGTPSGGFPTQGGGYPPQQQPYGQQPPYGQQYPPTGGAPQQQHYGGGEQVRQFGAYQPQGYPGQEPKKKGGAGIWIAVVVAVLLVGAVAVLGFVTPGWFNKKVFDQAAMQQGVQSILTEDYNVEKLDSVACPTGQEVKKDSQFACTAVIDGKEHTVNITVRDENSAEYEVATPVAK
ncbi:MAG: DUF4333 domain-containing protein [Actinomycetota bacterium]|nr:DUF4333 domain-containing protein [Actinomycetota bacterium]